MGKKNQAAMGAFLAVSAGVLWGIISIFVKPLTAAGLDSFQIVAYRALFAAGLLFVFIFIKDRSLFKFRLKDIWVFLGSGILSLTFFNYCYFTNFVRSGVAISVVLLYTSPVFVLFLSFIFFKEKLTKKKIVAIIMTIMGCAVVSGFVEAITSGGSIDSLGLILGLGSGFGYALYSLFAGIALKKGYDSFTITFYTFLFAGISMFIIAGPGKVIEGISGITLPWILGTAFFCTVLPYIAYTAGMKKIEVSKAAIFVTVEPLVGALLGILVFGEPAGIIKIIGIVLILVSVATLNGK